MTEQTTEGDASTNGASEVKGFTQEQVNAMLAEQKRKTSEKFADYGDLKARAARADELEAASATDLEKAVKAARDEGRTEAVQAGNARLIRAEARAQAAEIGFTDPLDAIALVDLADINVSDDGNVDAEAVKKQLTDLAANKKYLLKSHADTASSSDAGIGTTGTAVTDGSPQSLIRQGLAGTSKTK